MIFFIIRWLESWLYCNVLPAIFRCFLGGGFYIYELDKNTKFVSYSKDALSHVFYVCVYRSVCRLRMSFCVCVCRFVCRLLIYFSVCVCRFFCCLLMSLSLLSPLFSLTILFLEITH